MFKWLKEKSKQFRNTIAPKDTKRDRFLNKLNENVHKSVIPEWTDTLKQQQIKRLISQSRKEDKRSIWKKFIRPETANTKQLRKQYIRAGGQKYSKYQKSKLDSLSNLAMGFTGTSSALKKPVGRIVRKAIKKGIRGNSLLDIMKQAKRLPQPKIPLLPIGKKTAKTPFQAKRFFKKGMLAGYKGVKSSKRPIKLAPPGGLDQFLQGIPQKSTDIPKNLSPLRKLFTSGGRILEESGAGGKRLSELIKSQRLDEDLIRGGYQSRLNNILKGVKKKDRILLTDILEGKVKTKSKKAQQIRKLLDEIGTKAEKEGFQIRVGNKNIPFKKRQNYFPRIYNFDKLTKGKHRDKALKHLVETGQARNLAEAEKLLSDFISGNVERRAGNLEYARQFDLPGYEKDPAIALENYIAKVSKRFSEAKHFGKKDEKTASLIDRIAKEGGDYREAQKIFDLTTQGNQTNKFVKAATQWNLATKLDLSAITNATQSLNTMTKAGIKNTIKGAIKGFTKEGKEFADLAGVYENFIHVREQGFKPSKIVRGVLYPFKKVEEFNRRTAGNTAKYRVEQLAKRMKTNKNTKYAVRELKKLGVDPFKALKGKLTVKDLKTAANKLSEATQFKVDPIDVPPAWKSNLGKLAFQFKSFSFMQAKFIRDEILKEATKGNLAPMIRFLILAPLASFGAYKVRNKVTGRKEKPGKDADIRKWDKWARAAGALPTDLAIQGKFLYDTWKKPYLTPLKKLSGTASTIGGATVGEAGNILTALEDKARIEADNKSPFKKDWQKKDPNLEIKRYLSGIVPFAGEGIKNKYFSYDPSISRYSYAKKYGGEMQFKDKPRVYGVDKKQYSEKLDKVFKEYMPKVVNYPNFQNLPEDKKQEVLDTYSKQFEKKAKIEMINEMVQGKTKQEMREQLLQLKETGFLTKELYKAWLSQQS